MKPRKICTVEGCSFPLFARGFCGSHYKSFYLHPKMNEINKLREFKKKIKKAIIEKGPVQKKTFTGRIVRYQRKRLRFIEKERDKDPQRRIFCIFCGLEISGKPSLHHYDGRDGSLLLDESKWVLSHNDCHVNQYHSQGWEKLTWWQGYLDRIKDKYPLLYQKELSKMEK